MKIQNFYYWGLNNPVFIVSLTDGSRINLYDIRDDSIIETIKHAFKKGIDFEEVEEYILSHPHTKSQDNNLTRINFF